MTHQDEAQTDKIFPTSDGPATVPESDRPAAQPLQFTLLDAGDAEVCGIDGECD